MAGLSIASIQQITAHMFAAGGSPPASPSPSASPGSSGVPDWVGVVSALAAVLSAFAAVWFPLIAGPRYRLRWGPVRKVKLRDGSWRVRVYLSGRGRRDITKDAFDEGRPVVVNLGVPIRGLTSVASSQDALRLVTHRAEGYCVVVGPGLIGRRQDLRFIVTTVAKPKGVACRASLIDVQVRRQRLTPWERYYATYSLTLSAYAFAWVLAARLFQRFFNNVVFLHPWYMIAAWGIGFLVIVIGIYRRNPHPLN